MSQTSEDLSVVDRSVVSSNHGRPISWVVVVLVCGGFILAGIAMTIPIPWLAYVGLGIVVFGAMLGGLTHAMAHGAPHVATPTRPANASGVPAGRSPSEKIGTQPPGPSTETAETTETTETTETADA